MGVAVVHGDGRVAAIAVVLGAPTAADQPAEIDVEAVVLRAAAIDAPDHEIGVVAGDDVLGNGGGQRPAGGGPGGHGVGQPPAPSPRPVAPPHASPPPRRLSAPS